MTFVNNNERWKLTVKSTMNQSKSYFTLDRTYKLCARWQTHLPNLSTITNINIAPVNNLSIATTDSFSVMLNVAGIGDKLVGTLDAVSTEMNIYNPKQYVADNNNNLCIYIYSKASGISSTKAYQSAAANYDIFMSQLSNIWRDKLISILSENCKYDPNKQVPMNNMYELLKKLHKRCKSDQCWIDMKLAVDKSFENNKKKENLNAGFGGQQLFEALSKFKLRGIVLLIEYEMERFIKHCMKGRHESNEFVLLFPECNNYFRLLIDKIAERFGCNTKTFGNGYKRRILVYCSYSSSCIQAESVPNKLKDVFCFIPILKLKDFIQFGQFNHLIDKSLKYMVNVINANKDNKFSDFVKFTTVSVNVKGLSNDIICNNALFVYFEWNNLFGANNLNLDKETIDINMKNIGYEHIYEIEIFFKENTNFDLNVLRKYMHNFINNNGGDIDGGIDMKQIDMNRILIILKNTTFVNVELMFNKFYESNLNIGRNVQFKINTMQNASDVTKYICGFVGNIMNKTRGVRDTQIAKRIIQRYTR